MRKIRYNVVHWLCLVRIKVVGTLDLTMTNGVVVTCTELVDLRIRGLGGPVQDEGEASRYSD